MIDALSIRWRWLRYKWNRTRLSARLLGLELPKQATEEPGLVMIQIDGLSRHQLESALAAGRMPHLSHLLRRSHFTLGSFYSGVPSTTPAVQAEIFYGVKAAVPSFEFLDRSSGRLFRMYESESAEEIERRMRESGAEPLLKGAHVYSNIYRAGCAESHYCSADLCMERIAKRLHPFKRLLLSLIHLPAVLRGIGLALLELFIAIGDVIAGTIAHGNFFDELRFVPARVGICVAAREAIRFRVLLDIARGVPLIHANFLGYDEQAHRRGPNSDFAHWTLKGIDRTIRDIHRAAEGTPMVAYELLIYSDHGQEEATPYESLYGRPVGEAIAEVFSSGVTAKVTLGSSQAATPPRAHPARGFDPAWRRRLLHQRPGHVGFGTPEECASQILVSAMGPIGHIYLPLSLEDRNLKAYATALVRDAGIPLVIYPSREAAQACVFNRRGEWVLPQDAAEVLGQDHPFLEEAAADLVRLAHHANAGDLIFSGWDPQGSPLTFPREWGAHGGPGTEETHGFVLIPDRIFRWHLAHHASRGRWMRGTELREVVQHYLGRDGRRQEIVAAVPERDPDQALRVMTYNIHSCVGLDGRIRPERIARVLNAFDPDLIAVQEVDAHRPRSGGHDQAKAIAEHLRLEHAFYAVFEEQNEKYGIAVFSRFPFEIVKTAQLTPAYPRRREARGAMWITLPGVPGGKKIHLINTHFGLGREERKEQVDILLGPDWIGGIPPEDPVILCGDLNSRQRSYVWQRLQARLQDVQLKSSGTRLRATFPAPRPLLRIDHLFVSDHFAVQQVVVPDSSTARVASDHLPLGVELNLKDPTESP